MTETEAELIRRALGAPLRHVARWAIDHLVSVLAAGTALAVVLKLLAVAHFNASTGFALVVRIGVLQAGLGTLALLLPALAATLFATVAALFVRQMRRLPRRLSEDHDERVADFVAGSRAAYLGMATAAVGAFLFIAVPALYGALALVLMLLVTLVLGRSSLTMTDPAYVDERGWWDRRFRLAVLLVVAAALPVTAFAVGLALSTLFDDRMWLPAEVVTPPGEQQWVGYLIERDDGSALYLRDDDRVLVRVPLDVADATTTCMPTGLVLWSLPPPLQMLRGDRQHSGMPFCPTS